MTDPMTVVHQLPPPLELVWDDRWDTPPALPAPLTSRRRVCEDGAVLHTSTDLDGGRARVSVGTAPGAVIVLLDGGRFDTATSAGRDAVFGHIAALQAALDAGYTCTSCMAEPGENCAATCRSHEKEA